MQPYPSSRYSHGLFHFVMKLRMFIIIHQILEFPDMIEEVEETPITPWIPLLHLASYIIKASRIFLRTTNCVVFMYFTAALIENYI